MSTTAIIARPTADGGFAGRAVSADGYPDHTGVTLLNLVDQYGLDNVLTYMVDAPGEWAQVGRWNNPPRHYNDRGDFGVTYRSSRCAHRLFTSASDADWIYILTEDGIRVLGRGAYRFFNEVVAYGDVTTMKTFFRSVR